MMMEYTSHTAHGDRFALSLNFTEQDLDAVSKDIYALLGF